MRESERERESVCTPLTLKHVSVGVVRDGEDVWRHLRAPLPSVHVHHLVGVDGQHTVGVDCHTEES